MANQHLPLHAADITVPPTLAERLGLYQYNNKILVLMLMLLHFNLVLGVDHAWARAIALVHYGTFLLWQPLFGSKQPLSWLRSLGILAVGLGLAFIDNVWIGVLWTFLLAGLMGGMAVGLKSRRERAGIGLAFVYLLLMLFVWLLPQRLGLPMPVTISIPLVRDCLLILPVLILFFPSPKMTSRTGVSDLLYTLLFGLVIGVLALGSYVAMHLARTGYAQGVLISFGSLAVSLLIIAWLWQPRGEGSGLRNLFSRYVMSLGLPLEDWLKQLPEIAERESDPEMFLHMALAGFTHLPWSTGVTWRAQHSTGALGKESRYQADFTYLGVKATFYTSAQVNPALALHLRLLTEIIGYFHAAKIRESEMRANAYSQAIFETGSRLTHDVKNLLQSLKTLCSAAEHSKPDQAASLQNLMQRQLPQMTKRLEITLDKLKSPEQGMDASQVLAREWWRGLKNRYAREGIDCFVDDEAATAWLPHELFDSVADNLVQNALRKRTGESGIRIQVSLATMPIPVLTVCDSGKAIDPIVVEKLFHSPVSTHDGLGIGLYQAAKQSSKLGYRLELAKNWDGMVCFSLWQETLI